MTPFSLRFVIGLVRAWTRVYTCGMGQTRRDARRAEVESDLWEHAHADDCPPRPLEILGRLLLGVPDDLRWVLEQGGDMLGATRRGSS